MSGKSYKCKLNNELLVFLIIFIISAFVALQARFSPISNHFAIQDQAAFLVIGKSINYGYIPFKDIIDVKGILFFLYEALCYKIGGQMFIWISNIFFMSFSIFLTLKITSFFCTKKNIHIIILLYLITILSSYNYRINTIEIFALPFILMGLSPILKILFKNRPFNFISILISSCCLFILIHIKMNFSMPILVLGTYFIYHLLQNHDYSNFKKTIIGFIISFFIVNIPILIYLLINNALKGYVTYYIIYGFQYTNVVSFENRLSNFVRLLSNIGCFVSIFFIIISFFCHQKIENKNYWLLVAIFIGTLFVSVGLSGYNFEHYLIIIVPLFSFFISIVLDNIKNKHFFQLCRLTLFITMLFYSTYLIHNIIKIIEKRDDQYEKSLREISLVIKNRTKPHDKISIYAIDPSLYILSNRNPGSYAFAYADMIIEAKETEKNIYLKSLLDNNNTLIISNQNHCFFKDYIIKKYNLIYRDNMNNVIYEIKK